MTTEFKSPEDGSAVARDKDIKEIWFEIWNHYMWAADRKFFKPPKSFMSLSP